MSAQDIRYNPGWNLPTARIYNVSSQPIRNVKIAFYGGFSSEGRKPITVQQIPNIENPNDLAPRMVTVGMNYRLDQPTNIYVAIDPDDEINSEITALKNVAHKRLMDSGVNAKRPGRNLLNFYESEDEEARSSFIEYFDTFCYRYILWICHQNNPEKIRLSDAVTFILNIVTFRCARFRSNGWSHLLKALGGWPHPYSSTG